MFETILWASDGSENADSAFLLARELAGSGGRTLVAVHSRQLMVGPNSGYPVLVDDDELLSKVRGQVDTARAEGLDATFKLVTGAGSGCAHMIAEVAREVGADVIVVGTRGH